VQDVQKASCDLAATKLTRSRDALADSIGVEIAGVDAEVRRLRADLESAKEDLQRTRTELAAVQAEADRVSHALTGVKLDLEREGRTCKTLEADVKDLRVQLLAAQEAQRVPEEVSRFLATTAEVQLVEEDETMTWRAQIRTDSGRTQSLHADTLSSRTRGADAPARDEGAPAKRPREGDSAAEVDARRSFVALYVPSVVGTEWTELVLPGGSSVVPAAVFNCPAPEGPQEQWVQMALYGGAFVFGVLADVLEAKNARECKGKADVPESAHQKQPNRKNTWQRFAAARTDKKSTGKASSLDGNVFYLPSESDPCGGQGVGDRGPAAALINMLGVRALLKVTITLSTLSLSLSGAM
jgi:hypothetical protein